MSNIQTRTELTLARIGSSWRLEPQGRLFSQALLEFLQSKTNHNTARSYSYSILEFFGWYELVHNRLPTPDRVRRSEAVDFEQWLRKRRYGLTESLLLVDPKRTTDAVIYRAVRDQPGLNIDQIREAVAASARASERDLMRLRERDNGPDPLAKRLACLVSVKTLKRTPSLRQIRTGEVDIGIPEWARSRVGIDVAPPHSAFSYYAPELTSAPAERASIVSTRLTALSGFWSHLMQLGENHGRLEPLLKVNIWSAPLNKAKRQAPSHQRANRALKTPGEELFERLLATTFERRYGVGALAMAASIMRPSAAPGPPIISDEKPSFSDIRDRAMMLMLAQTGLRCEEIYDLSRSSVIPSLDPSNRSPRTMKVLGKGGKARVIRLPTATLKAIFELSRKLAEMAEHQKRYHNDDRAAFLLKKSAPLLPSIAQWGRNAGHSRVTGLKRSGIAMMLRRRATRAGIHSDSPDIARIHPHGLRHLFAKSAIEAGSHLAVVQAVMGHSTGAQTMQYAEEHDHDKLISARHAQPTEEKPADPPAGRAIRPVKLTRRAARKPPDSAASPPQPVVERKEPAAPKRPATTPVRRRRVAVDVPRPQPRPVEAERTRRKVVVEQTAPPAPRAERLVGFGGAPKAHIEKSDASEKQALEMLDSIYRLSWGERGRRSRLGTTSLPTAVELAEVGFDGELEALLGFQSREGFGAGRERLVHAYAGKQSGLVWWSGSMGKMSPDMPIISPSQVGECDPDQQGVLCDQLVDLWKRWMDGDGPGPTAAAALVRWVAEALSVSEQAGAEIARRGGQWVPAGAPWDATSGDQKPRLVFREHTDAAILKWFEENAWQFRTHRTRGQKVVGEPLDAPDYYGDEDPIAQLEDDERSDMLDWIAALSGQQPRDRRPRFQGSSRNDVARFVTQMCMYDQQLDLLGEIKADRRRGEGTAIEERAVLRSAAAAADQVNRLASRMLDGKPFDIAAESAKRVAKRKGVEGKREYRRDFYVRVVRRLFGDDAANDPAIRLVAMCGRTPLGDGRFRKLFRIDSMRRSIVHDTKFAEEFARETSSHSECVARRLARDLWEMQKRHTSGVRQRALTRPDELVSLVESFLAYRIPCPQPQERQLRRRLKSREPLPVYESWRRVKGSRTPSRPQDSRMAEIQAELASFEEEYHGAIQGDFVRSVFSPNPARYTKRASAMMPTPLHLLAAILN